MLLLDHGVLGDRPWAAHLAALGAARGTVQLLLHTGDGKRHAIALANGKVVGATSPLAADAALRIALADKRVSASRIREASRRLLRDPRASTCRRMRDELAAFVEVLELSPADIYRIRRRVLAQRAARTFAIADATVAVHERIAIPVLHGAELDIRAVIYRGARDHLDPKRLGAGLRGLGPRLELEAGPLELVGFELTEDELPVIDALRGGTTLGELDALHRSISRALVYSLAACGLVQVARKCGKRRVSS